MDGVPAIHSCPTSSGPAWVGPFSSQHGAIRHSEKLFKLGHSGLASPHRSSPCLPHAAACHPDRSGGISPLFLPSRHPDPVGASRRQRSGMADRWYTAPMAAKKKTKKKHTKRTAGKKLNPVKKALNAKLAKKATPKNAGAN